MEWYNEVILFLSFSNLACIAFTAWMVSTVNELRVENAKLRIDLLHK